MGTETADLAVAHLARGKAGHHTVGKPKRGVDVVDRTISRATAGRRQAHHRRLSQLKHQVEVVDHQIKHHRHIVGAIGMGAVAASFQHHNLFVGHHFGELSEGWIEAFDMAHLQQAAIPACGSNQR